MKRVREVAGKLGIDQEMLRRGVNVGFSGGEKKRNEILQMALLEPRLAVLDETDSGLDIDALKIVADGVNRLRSPERALRGDHALSAAARLHRARRRARAVEGPHREDRRQGAGARARSAAATRNIRTRRREVAMNAEVRPIKTAAETALATNFAAAKRGAAGRGGGRGVARGRVPSASRREGLPHRRVEEWKYTDLRALMRDAKPLAAPPDAAAKARAKQTLAHARRRSRRAAIVFVDGAFVPELSDLAEPGSRPHHRLDGAARSRPAIRSSSPHLGQAGADRRCGGRAQYRVHG